jgi:transposase
MTAEEKMAGKLTMGQKELVRGKVMEMVKQGQLTLKEAAVRIKVSYRQAKRIYRRYGEGGDAALIHRNQGKVSNRRMDAAVKEQALTWYREKYYDFGPTFAAEKLQDEGIAVSAETVRQWLMEAGLWERKRRSNPYRSRRDRKEHVGELVQFDGSHHDWFEGRRRKCCLMNMVDDATGITLSMLFEEETTAAAMTVLSCWIKKYGIPQALYCDHKNAFVSNRESTVEEQLAGIEPKSHFEKACGKLGIEVIAANSPQAKGRVERNHAVYQDRFVKELRLAGISTTEDANRFLEHEYLPKINAKFSHPAASREDAHVPLLGVDLREIMCFEEERVVSKDFVISFKNRLFQILPGSRPCPRPNDKVTVRVRLDGSLDVYFQNKKLSVREIQKPLKKEAA